ncbi:MAG: hypothetical protein N3F06_03435 [Nitrososphaerales archaeon]|nr:hypothetical protein [Nitrososphaerales archaeon]
MVLILTEEDAGIIRVDHREAIKLDRYFDVVVDYVRELYSNYNRIFVCFPDVQTAKKFRQIYRERIGELSEHDFEDDEEVILKFSL